MAEDTNRARLWFEQPKNMLRSVVLARAILANETENQAGGYLEGDSIQREFRTELPAEIRIWTGRVVDMLILTAS